MHHFYRVVFVVFLLIVSVYALTRYSEQHQFQVLEKRLVPMQPKGAAPGAPPMAPMPQPSGPGGDNSDAPLFSVDIEDIPQGLTARGTSFPLGTGLWLTARHVVNEGCAQIIMIIGGQNVPAEIKFLDPNADLAVLQTQPIDVPPLPIETADPANDESAYAFGFPHGILGGTQDQLIGRARMKLGGRLSGVAPVLTWAELARFPDNLESLSGISGGPMLDANGNIIGIIVAASVRRGRNYTVAPEILHAIQQELKLTGPFPNEMPASDAVKEPVSLENSAHLMSNNARVALTYCIPPGSE